jgi:hypothetical protein
MCGASGDEPCTNTIRLGEPLPGRAMHYSRTYQPVPEVFCRDCGRILPNGSAETLCLECKEMTS